MTGIYSRLESSLQEGNIVEFVNTKFPWELGEKVICMGPNRVWRAHECSIFLDGNKIR